jgi:hypothetical protein
MEWTLKGLERYVKELFNYRIEEVPGNQLDEDTLGITDFDKKAIRIPDFRTKGFHPIKNYIKGHELYVEALGRPGNEDEHSLYESEYLDFLKDNDYRQEYLTGLALHKLRNRYGDREGFSGKVFRHLEKRYLSELQKDLEEASEMEPLVMHEYGMEPSMA